MRHLLFPVLISASAKLFCIASRGDQATKFYNNFLNNFIQVVKTYEDFVDNISKRSKMSSFNSTNYNRINMKRNSSWVFNNVGVFFLPVYFNR